MRLLELPCICPGIETSPDRFLLSWFHLGLGIRCLGLEGYFLGLGLTVLVPSLLCVLFN